MLIIEAGPMVIRWEINSSKQEQSLAEVQKTIAIYDFAKPVVNNSKLRAGNGKKAWCCVVYTCSHCKFCN